MTDRNWDRSLVFTAILVALIAVGCIWLTISAAPNAITRFSLLAFLPALGAAVASYALRTLRFHYFLRRSGIQISLLRTMRIQLVGFALAVTPGRVGELFKLRLINENAGTPLVQAAPLLLLDRLTEGGGFLILAIASGLLIPSLEGDIPAPRLLLVGLAAMIVLVITRRYWSQLAEFGNGWLVRSRFGQRLVPHLRNFWRGLDASFTARQIAGGLGLSVLARFADGIAVFFIARMLGVSMAVPAAVFVLAAGGLVGGASFLPAGIGIVEATMTGLMVLMGIGLPNAIAITLFARLSTLWLWVVIGLGFAFRLRFALPNEELSATVES